LRKRPPPPEGGFDGRFLTVDRRVCDRGKPRSALKGRSIHHEPPEGGRGGWPTGIRPAETGADEPDVNRPRPPVGTGSIAKLLSFQRPRASRARPRSLANRIAKHKSVASRSRQEVRAQPQKLGNPLQRPGRVEHDIPERRLEKPLLDAPFGRRADDVEVRGIPALPTASALELDRPTVLALDRSLIVHGAGDVGKCEKRVERQTMIVQKIWMEDSADVNLDITPALQRHAELCGAKKLRLPRKRR